MTVTAKQFREITREESQNAARAYAGPSESRVQTIIGELLHKELEETEERVQELIVEENAKSEERIYRRIEENALSAITARLDAMGRLVRVQEKVWINPVYVTTVRMVGRTCQLRMVDGQRIEVSRSEWDKLLAAQRSSDTLPTS